MGWWIMDTIQLIIIVAFLVGTFLFMLLFGSTAKKRSKNSLKKQNKGYLYIHPDLNMLFKSYYECRKVCFDRNLDIAQIVQKEVE